MANQENKGLKRIINATGYSWKGFVACYQNEEAFRQEFWLSLILIPAAFFITNDKVNLALMIGSVLLVLIVELLNSGIEAVVDRIGLEKHELSGRAKDIGSAAVFVSLTNVVLVWGLIIIL
ncbi:MAG: diacylglycerol kinase [Gammaproteobacteria bacterium]|nr:diacylglycerol kinase [Gammaproteobacteria bacterium]